MKEIFTEENVKISVDALLEKSDSCGTDGIYVSQYKEFWELNEEKILNGILEGQYKPDAVKKIEILKTNGKKRILAQYTCTDRVILDVIKRKLTPMWEGKFSKYSFAYQENKGVQSAVKQAAQFIEEGRCWVAELDVENFFDHVNLERMESMLRKKITDESLMRLIHQYLYIMVAEEFKETRNIIGLLQGNPLSPLFSNIYMEQFDLYMEQNYSYCRFSDDINIYCKSQKEAEKGRKKYYIPVETCGSINIYSKITFGSAFFEYANQKHLMVNLFDKYGEYVGGFCTASHYEAGKTMLKQAEIYNNSQKRLEIAKSMELASLHNHRENLRYYNKRKNVEVLKTAIDQMTEQMSEMKKCRDMEQLLLIEARAKQKYLQALDTMIHDEEFIFEKRTRRPPQNPLNALISFGNVFLYRRIATEIHKTALDIRIGFVHATNNRSESLNLDIAEIFKPIIVDRAIFTAIHNMEIRAEEHFAKEGEKGIYLNKEGKRIFIRELERKLYQKISVDGKRITYDTLIRNEIKKVLHMVQKGEKYKPFKYT